MRFEDLTPEQRERVRACKSGDELARLARQAGVALTDDELSQISGGVAAWERPETCDGVYHVGPFRYRTTAADGDRLYRCEGCGEDVYESALKEVGIVLW